MMTRPVAAKTTKTTAIGSKVGVGGVDTVVDSFLSSKGEILLVKLCFTLGGNRYAVIVNDEYEYFATLTEAAQAYNF